MIPLAPSPTIFLRHVAWHSLTIIDHQPVQQHAEIVLLLAIAASVLQVTLLPIFFLFELLLTLLLLPLLLPLILLLSLCSLVCLHPFLLLLPHLPHPESFSLLLRRRMLL